MAKRYKTWEVIKELTENPKMKFKNDDGYEIYVTCGIIHLDYKNGSSYGFSGNIRINTVGNFKEDEWELIRQPVSFMEAVKAYSEGKTTIYCIFNGCKHVFNDGAGPDKRLYTVDAGWHKTVSAREILEGEWYIEEADAE